MRFQSKRNRKLKVGDWVEVRSKEEILKTLDSKGQYDSMPFMPEMFRFCGTRFQVYKRAHKTCDYSTPYPFRTRRLEDTVHLNTRCDGEAHDGCQAGCLLYWKLAWLKPVSGPVEESFTFDPQMPSGDSAGASSPVCSEAEILAQTKIPDPNGGAPTYFCQVTQIPYATRYLAWWDLRQYLEDYRSGNVGIRRLIDGLFFSPYYHLSHAGIGVGPMMRWFYNKICWLWGGTLYPRMPGLIPDGERTPAETLNLQPGELVRVKAHEEILKTVDASGRNRGMYWDAELVPYCGKTYRVLRRVSKVIDEKTSKMVEMKNPCIVLDNVVCQARYSSCRMLCPKAMYPFWREIWLERVEADKGEDSRSENDMASTSATPSCGS
jgi:hypothetical protein